MPRKRTGDGLELTKEEHVRAAKLAFAPADDPDRRSPLLKVSDIVEKLNESREERKLPSVGPDTVNRAIRRAIESKWVVASPREVVGPDIARLPELEQRLQETLKLDSAIVIDCKNDKVRNRGEWEAVQVQLGFALAEYLAEGGNREFRRSAMRSWGLGGGHAVRAFAQHMVDLSPVKGWPAQRVYSLAGSWSDELVEIGGNRVLLDANSAATDFASCFEPGRELYRVSDRLIASDPDDASMRRARTRLSSFGNDGNRSTAILGVSFGLLQIGVRARGNLDRQLDADVTAILQEPGQVTNDTSDVRSAYVPYTVAGERTEEVSAFWEDPSEVGGRLISATEQDLKRADEICLIGGGGQGTGDILDNLLAQSFTNVCHLATTSGSAEELIKLATIVAVQ